MKKIYTHAFKMMAAVSCMIFVFSGMAFAQTPRTLVVALDGVPYELFKEAQAQGMFEEFYPASKMISTFPSLSDPAFSNIFRLDSPLGYQRIHFSPTKNKVVGVFVNELIRPEEYQLRFDSVNNGKIHYAMIYIRSNSMAREEVDAMAEDFFASPDSEVFYAFIEAVDPILHKYGREKAMEFLAYLHTALHEIEARYMEETGMKLRIAIFSDHGNTMVKGQLIPIKPYLIEHGYVPSDKLKAPNYVAWTASGIVSCAVLYTFEETKEQLANDLVDLEGVDLITYQKGHYQYVLNEKGLARIDYDPIQEEGKYEILTGDPLDYGPVMEQARAMGWMDEDGYVPDDKLFELTVDHKYPNAIWRIYYCFNGAVIHTATLVLSLKEGYEFANPTVKVIAKLSSRVGTHGGLNQVESAGVIVTNFIPTQNVDTRTAGDYLETERFVRKDSPGSITGMARKYSRRFRGSRL